MIRHRTLRMRMRNHMVILKEEEVPKEDRLVGEIIFLEEEEEVEEGELNVMPMERHDICIGNVPRGRESYIYEAQKNVEAEAIEGGQNIMMRKFLLKPEKETEDPVQRMRLFRTAYKTKDKVCKIIIDSGSTDNLVSTEMVEKMKLEIIAHPSPYKVS
jgi:hypothetical protein